MKFILIDNVDGDIFTKEFDTCNEAIAYAKDEWGRLSEHDKQRRKEFYVLESYNPDEDAENHFDGDIAWDAVCKMVTMVAKWVNGVGIVHTTEYDEKDVNSDLDWADVDDSWAEELLDDLDNTSCERFSVWYELRDADGILLDESGSFWVEGEDYR